MMSDTITTLSDHNADVTIADGEHQQCHDTKISRDAITNSSSGLLSHDSAAHTTSFPFLDLPKELRLIVYDQFVIQTRHDRMSARYHDTAIFENEERGEIEFTLITKSLPGVSILRTCRQIYTEALPFFRAHIDAILTQPPRIIVPLQSIEHLIWDFGPLIPLVDYSMHLRDAPSLQFSDYVIEASTEVKAMEPSESCEGCGHFSEIVLNPIYQNFVEKSARQILHYQRFPSDLRLDHLDPDWDDKRGSPIQVIEVGITLANWDEWLNFDQTTAWTDTYDYALAGFDVLICGRIITHAFDSGPHKEGIDAFYEDVNHHIDDVMADAFYHMKRMRFGEEVGKQEWDSI